VSTSPLFSVIIPTHNGSSAIRGAIGSVLTQSFPSFEIVVVDDGSTDATHLVLQAVDDPRVRYLRTPHGGPSAARNVGAVLARGRYITFLDSDDRAAPGWLATLASGFDEPRTEVVRCGHVIIGREGTATRSVFPRPAPDTALDVAGFASGTYALPLWLFRQVGGFNESLTFGEHTELAIRIVDRWSRRLTPPVRAFESLLVRRAPSGRRYGAAQGQMARFVLSHHRGYVRGNPHVRSIYHRIAGVERMKAGDVGPARRHLAHAFLVRPWKATDGARTLAALVPPVSRAIWGASKRRSSPHVMAASADGTDQAAVYPDCAPGGRIGRRPDLVSVIVPVRNGARTIENQLAALAAQDFTGAWELIVVDNHSTDGTREVVERQRWRFPGLRLVEAWSVGSLSHARNVGLRAAMGDFVAFCDADDVVSAGWLSSLVSAAPIAGLVAGAVDTSAMNEEIHREVRFEGGVDLAPVLGFLPFATGGSFGVWRDVAWWLGGWREDYPAAEDVEFAWRAQLAGFSLVAAPDAIVNVRLRSTLSTFARQMFHYAQGHVLLFRDYRPAGVGRRSMGTVARRTAWLVLNAPRAAIDARERWRWTRVASQLAGHVWGSARYRTLYV
jgi:glycosyltransferase involved in cell wall biosynthesis